MKTWFRRWQKKQARIKKGLKKSRLFRIWGNKLFADSLWKINRRSVAGGLALGLFMGFMPSIGIQSLLIAFGAIYFKVNLPLALVVCWVTNPFTAVPIYFAEWRLGKYLLNDFTSIQKILKLHGVQGTTVNVIMQGLYLWTGAFIFSIGSALTAYLAVMGLWKLPGKFKKQPLPDQPADSSKSGSHGKE